MANAYNYSNVANPTTLAGNISAGATTISVLSTVGWPTTPYIVAIDYGASTEELAKVTGVAGLALTVTRGFGGTSAQSHSLGAVVRPVYNAQDATDFRTHEDATSGVHGVTGAVVGRTDVQTLTNKTLTNPTINGASFTGVMSSDFVINGVNNLNSVFTLKAAVGQSTFMEVKDSSNNNKFVITDTGGVSTAALSVGGTLDLTGVPSVTWGNGVGAFKYAYKAADTTRTTTTLAADPDLTVSVVSGHVYIVEAFFAIKGDSAGDVKVGWTGSHTGLWGPVNFGSSTSTDSGSPELVASLWTTVRNFGLNATGTTNYGIHVRGTLTATSTGTLAVNWAALAAGTGSTLSAGSHIRLQRIA